MGIKVFRMRKVKYSVHKTREPDDNGKYAVYYEIETEHGCNYGIVKESKGNFRDCQKLKKEIENEGNTRD